MVREIIHLLSQPTRFLSYFLPTILWRGVRAAWWALAGQLRSIHYSAVDFHSPVDCWCLWLWKESAMALPRLSRTHLCRLACSWGERQLSSPGMGKRQKLSRNCKVGGGEGNSRLPLGMLISGRLYYGSSTTHCSSLLFQLSLFHHVLAKLIFSPSLCQFLIYNKILLPSGCGFLSV